MFLNEKKIIKKISSCKPFEKILRRNQHDWIESYQTSLILFDKVKNQAKLVMNMPLNSNHSEYPQVRR